jgi:adenosine deaminase
MPYQADEELAGFVQSLPKTETHLHMEGACPIELLREIDPVRYRDPPVMWRDDFRYESFDQFMVLYAEYCSAVFSSAEQYGRAAKIVLGRCFEQNVRYVETSFHSGAVEGGRDSGPDIVNAIKDAAPAGLEVRVFMGMSHDARSTPEGRAVVDDCHNWAELDGIDLHGPEYIPVEDWTAVVWERAREAGKFTKAHAGEFMGADFVGRILDELKVTRIEHGVRSIEDPAVVERLVRDGIALDICPISNVKLAVEGVPSMSGHPIRQLYDAGVTVTINSDDPFMFGNALREEYYALSQDLGFSRLELARIARAGFDIALWQGEGKEAAVKELDSIIAGLTG